jgi:hypothetical protein
VHSLIGTVYIRFCYVMGHTRLPQGWPESGPVFDLMDADEAGSITYPRPDGLGAKSPACPSI